MIIVIKLNDDCFANKILCFCSFVVCVAIDNKARGLTSFNMFITHKTVNNRIVERSVTCKMANNTIHVYSSTSK